MFLSTKLIKEMLIRDVYAQYRLFANFLNIFDLQYQTYNVIKIREETLHSHYCLHSLSLLQCLRIRYFIEETHLIDE